MWNTTLRRLSLLGLMLLASRVPTCACDGRCAAQTPFCDLS